MTGHVWDCKFSLSHYYGFLFHIPKLYYLSGRAFGITTDVKAYCYRTGVAANVVPYQ